MTANTNRNTINDLLAYHRWANQAILGRCRLLSDEQLDHEEPMGWGTLRKTLYHVWAAESLWLSRWKGVSPTSFEVEDRVPIQELAARFEVLHAARDGVRAAESPADLSRVVNYRNLAGVQGSIPLVHLVMHIVNHAVHHRAQALHLLKLNGVRIPGGLDYIFYRIAVPTIAMPAPSRERMRGYGLEVGDAVTSPTPHSPELVPR